MLPGVFIRLRCVTCSRAPCCAGFAAATRPSAGVIPVVALVASLVRSATVAGDDHCSISFSRRVLGLAENTRRGAAGLDRQFFRDGRRAVLLSLRDSAVNRPQDLCDNPPPIVRRHPENAAVFASDSPTDLARRLSGKCHAARQRPAATGRQRRSALLRVRPSRSKCSWMMSSRVAAGAAADRKVAGGYEHRARPDAPAAAAAVRGCVALGTKRSEELRRGVGAAASRVGWVAPFIAAAPAGRR